MMINSKELAEFILTAAKELYIDNKGPPILISDYIRNKGYSEFEVMTLTTLLLPQNIKHFVFDCRKFISSEQTVRFNSKSETLMENLLKYNLFNAVKFSLENPDEMTKLQEKADILRFTALILGTEKAEEEYFSHIEIMTALIEKQGELIN